MATADDVRISIVLPCLNEERAVGQVVDQAWDGIDSVGGDGEVIVVDNGSTDRSAEIAEEHGARVVHETRRGYGSAYLRGLAEARGEIVVMGDADGTYPLGDLSAFVEAIDDGADLALGSRFQGRIHQGAMPWVHRWIGNPLLTFVLNVFFRVRVSDAHCGLRAIRRSVLPTLRLQSTGMEFASEMILKAAKRKLEVADIPIEYHPRIGESKLQTWRDGWRHLRFMLIHSATFLFLIPGALLFLLGLVVLVPMSGGPITIGGLTLHIHAMIVASTTTLIGAQIVQLGLFARTYAVLYLGDRDRMLEWVWSRFRLEHGLILGAIVAFGGLGLLLGIFVEWAASGYGALSREYLSLLGLTLAGLGVQTVFASFFLSVLGLRNDFTYDPRGEQARNEVPVTVSRESWE